MRELLRQRDELMSQRLGGGLRRKKMQGGTGFIFYQRHKGEALEQRKKRQFTSQPEGRKAQAGK